VGNIINYQAGSSQGYSIPAEPFWPTSSHQYSETCNWIFSACEGTSVSHVQKNLQQTYILQKQKNFMQQMYTGNVL